MFSRYSRSTDTTSCGMIHGDHNNIIIINDGVSFRLPISVHFGEKEFGNFRTKMQKDEKEKLQRK